MEQAQRCAKNISVNPGLMSHSAALKGSSRDLLINSKTPFFLSPLPQLYNYVVKLSYNS